MVRIPGPVRAITPILCSCSGSQAQRRRVDGLDSVIRPDCSLLPRPEKAASGLSCISESSIPASDLAAEFNLTYSAVRLLPFVNLSVTAKIRGDVVPGSRRAQIHDRPHRQVMHNVRLWFPLIESRRKVADSPSIGAEPDRGILLVLRFARGEIWRVPRHHDPSVSA